MAKFCPQCGLIILDRTLPACPGCKARLPWASLRTTAQYPTPPEPAEPAPPAEPAQAAEPGQPVPPPARPKAPARPRQALPPEPDLVPESPRTVSPPLHIPPVRPGSSPARHTKKPVTDGGTGTGAATRWIGICCGGMILLIFISAFIAIMSENSFSDSNAEEEVTWSPSPDGDTVTGAPTEIAVAMGRTASGPDAQATVYSAEKMPSYTWSPGSSNYTFTEEAENGTTFLIIDAEVKNTGSDTMYASTGDFYLMDGTGNRYEPGYYYGNESFSYLNELSGGQKKGGKILFAIPLDAQDLKIFYDFRTGYEETLVGSWSID